jgi:hypothetical protein
MNEPKVYLVTCTLQLEVWINEPETNLEHFLDQQLELTTDGRGFQIPEYTITEETYIELPQ